ncbi:GNAT family N-acetyltransferase [Deinococcus budaensis]|uniref:GNAT superfamily N-acetyltransferase n=1 Tax=Deinococcus budaensis TaxID=1665626 RepID=A0A7W8GJ86_9DEIO|nr:GNAT family N-acetyltransferase [Deinococcus budaensis]MBB5236116.1 GNAT superfamily N-acetyltransferase [Deinococcus budaensis]
MSAASAVPVRPARPHDAFLAVLLNNSSQEPHFHGTAARLAGALEGEAHGSVVAETAGRLTGLGTLWLPDFHPTHAWVGLHLHPDHRADGTPAALLEALAAQARAAGRERLWASVRTDYLPSWPDLPALGFRKVHRTFGGGFHLRGWAANTARLEAELERQGYTFTPAAPFRDDPRLGTLYALTREDKVNAAPTIPPAAERLPDGDALWDAAWLAWQGETLVGLALPERSRLAAWNAVLTVHPGHRRRGLATALLARVARRLQAQDVPFLNVAGSGRDAAYLGVLRRLGAHLEPDWVAWERDV